MTQEIPATLLLDPKVIEDPYPFYNRLHEQAPVWEVPGTGVFTVSTFELLAEAVGRVEDFSSAMKCLLYRNDAGLPDRFTFGDAGGQVLATADPPLHAIHRNAVFPELVAKRMRELESDVVDLAEGLVSRALDIGTVEFMTAIGNLVPMTIISRLIGFADSNLDDLWASAVNGTALLSSTQNLEQLMAVASTGNNVQAWIADQLTAALKEPAEDLLGAVARGVNEGVLSEHEGMGMLMTLLSAGGETTTSLLGNAVRMLADNPELQEHLRSNPEHIPTFAEEALRLESPFRYLMRSVPKDTTLGSVAIPADSTVLLLWGAANRDATEFERPGEIDLGRRIPRRHVAFGRGIHTCVGAPLARIEARVVLTVLLERTKSITLQKEQEPGWVNSLLVRRHAQLPVHLHAN
jgi:cytochrome P450